MSDSPSTKKANWDELAALLKGGAADEDIEQWCRRSIPGIAEDLKRVAAEWEYTDGDLEGELEEWENRYTEARTALKRYSNHDPDCSVFLLMSCPPAACSCGLSALLLSLDEH